MSNVTLSIGGRNFTVACADGEEAHVHRLGELIDTKISAAGASTHSEARMLLFASLLLADEIHELQRVRNAATFPPEMAERLALLAGRIENLADLLESAAPSA